MAPRAGHRGVRMNPGIRVEGRRRAFSLAAVFASACSRCSGTCLSCVCVPVRSAFVALVRTVGAPTIIMTVGGAWD